MSLLVLLLLRHLLLLLLLLLFVQIVADRYGFTDIFNGCLFRLLLRFNNTGPPDAVLYDMPLGWWDHDWKGCFKSRCAEAFSVVQVSLPLDAHVDALVTALLLVPLTRQLLRQPP